MGFEPATFWTKAQYITIKASMDEWFVTYVQPYKKKLSFMQEKKSLNGIWTWHLLSFSSPLYQWGHHKN